MAGLVATYSSAVCAEALSARGEVEPEPAIFQRDPQFPDPGSVCCGKAIVLTGAAALAPGLGRESLARGQLCIRLRAVHPIRCVYVALDSAWPMAATMVICAITLAPGRLPRGHL